MNKANVFIPLVLQANFLNSESYFYMFGKTW